MLNIDFNNEVVKVAPIAGTAAADGLYQMFWGLNLNEWFYVAAILYTLVQIGSKVVDIILKWKNGGKADE